MSQEQNKKRNSFGKKIRNIAIAGGISLLSFLPSNVLGQSNSDNTPDYIFAHEPAKVTAAGDGILAKSYIQNLPLTPNSDISIDSLFWAKDGHVHFNVRDSKESLNNIKNYLGSQSNLTGKEKAFKNHLTTLEGFVNENPGEKNSTKLLNKAVEDGTISVKEDSLYNEKTGEWNIEDGTYMLIAKNKDKSQSVPVLANISTHKENSPVLKRRGIESTLYGHNKNNEDTTSTSGSTLIKYDLQPEEKKEDEKQEEKQEGRGYSPVRLSLGIGLKGDTREGEITNNYDNVVSNASLQFDVTGGKGNIWLGPYASFSHFSKKQKIEETEAGSEKELVNRSEYGDTYRAADSSYVTTSTSSQPLTLGGKASFELGERGTSELELLLGATKTNASRKLEGRKDIQYSKNGKVLKERNLTGEDKDSFNNWTGTIGGGFKQYLTEMKNFSINGNFGYNFPLKPAKPSFKDNFYGEVGIGINIGGKK